MATRTLPRDIATFTGREAEIDQVMRALTDSVGPGSVVSIHAIDGMAGVGKTAFAVHVAHRLAPRFPDGQLFVRLHAHTPGQPPVDPAEALATLLLNNGIAPEQLPESLEARTNLWRDRMAEAKVLLLLDDAAGHEQVRPLLPGSEGSLVLVTSRRRLLALDDVACISLDTLSPDEAARLFIRLAARSDIQSAAHAVTDIIRRCGNLPLAIRIVAAQMASHPAWTVDGLAAELAAQSRVALMQAENTSVTAAFDLSYERLTADQQRLFRRLGLHPGSDFDAYAAAAIDDTDLVTARRRLNELYDYHLLDEPVQGRYRFHDLIREHASALVDHGPPTENEAALHRLLDYYQRAATIADQAIQEHGTQPSRNPGDYDAPVPPDLSAHAAAQAWLETERFNLAAAIGYAAAHHYAQVAACLSHGISSFARNKGYWEQTLALQKAALMCARDAGTPSDQIHILNDMAILQRQKGDLAAAAASAVEALQLSDAVNDRDAKAMAFARLGMAQFLSGARQDAITSMTKSLDLYRHLSDPAGLADCLLGLGEVQHDCNDQEAALASYEEALNLFRDLNSRYGMAHALNGIGMVQSARHDDVGAAASFQESLRLFRDRGDPRGEATVLINIGAVQDEREEYAAAMASWKQALKLFRRLGSPLGKSKALYNLGYIKCLSGDYLASISNFTEALELFRELGDKARTAEALYGLGRANSEAGNLAEAVARLTEALEICLELEDQTDAAATLATLGITHERAGRSDDALAAYDQAITLFPDNPSLFFNKGSLLFYLGRLDEAVPCLTEVIRLRPGDALGAHVLLGVITWPDDQGQAREHFAGALPSAGAQLTTWGMALYRSIALAGLGRSDEAHRELQLALPERSAHDADGDDTMHLLHRLQNPPLPGLDTLQALLGTP